MAQANLDAAKVLAACTAATKAITAEAGAHRSVHTGARLHTLHRLAFLAQCALAGQEAASIGVSADEAVAMQGHFDFTAGTKP